MTPLDLAERAPAPPVDHHRLQAIFEHAPVGITLTDVRGPTLVDVNPTYAAMVGFTRAELIGTSYAAMAPADELADVAEDIRVWMVAGAVGSLCRTVTVIRRDGSTFPAKLTLSAVRDDDGEVPLLLVGIYEDITEQLAADRARTAFVSVLGHELRTPLTSVRGALGLVASGITGTLPAEAQALLDVAMKNCDRLQRLVDEILDVQRLDAGHASLAVGAVSAADLVDLALRQRSGAAVSAGIALERQVPDLIVRVDRERVVQTLAHLLDNAIKFSRAGSRVTVTVTEEAGGSRFAVQDEGCGIPPDQLDTVFKAFHEVDASDHRPQGGAGLGLPICRGIVEQHGGRIWAESVVGEGTTVSFTLPSADAAGADAAETVEA